MLIKKEIRRSIQNVKAIPGEIQHVLVIAGKDKSKIRKVVRKTYAESVSFLMSSNTLFLLCYSGEVYTYTYIH